LKIKENQGVGQLDFSKLWPTHALIIVLTQPSFDPVWLFVVPGVAIQSYK
tara:strand:- start:13848 stop:13997 length:150 start_codon:yes stop_codon:yes gene_type:complete